MKALILFRSYHGNTKHVAEGIAKELGGQGIETIVQDLRRKLPALSDIDFILIGSPTRMAKVNRKALRVLKRFRKEGYSEKPIAIFDTYGPVPTKPEEIEKAKKWLYPGAAGVMQKTAKALGLNVYSEILRCEVRGMKGPLADNELEKAASFIKAFLPSIGKKP
jgi:menaquinone-dependent protoporphyrinogen IX oxidase